MISSPVRLLWFSEFWAFLTSSACGHIADCLISNYTWKQMIFPTLYLVKCYIQTIHCQSSSLIFYNLFLRNARWVECYFHAKVDSHLEGLNANWIGALSVWTASGSMVVIDVLGHLVPKACQMQIQWWSRLWYRFCKWTVLYLPLKKVRTNILFLKSLQWAH